MASRRPVHATRWTRESRGPVARATCPILVLLLTASVLAGCLSADSADRGAGRVLTDATGAQVDVSDLDRILPTSVDLVEILIQLGHRDRIVAVPGWIESSSGCIEVPEGAEDLPRIGRPHVINPEEALALDPTLVLEKPFPLSPTPLAEQLRRAGVDVFVFDHAETLSNLEETYRLVGEILAPVDPGAPAKAEAAWQALDTHIADLRTTIDAHREAEGTPAFRTVFQFPAGLVAAEGTSAALLLELAGAHDIASAAGLTGYKQLSSEALADADPERVVATCTSANSPGILLGAPKYATTTAARLGPESVRIVDPSHAGLVGPRFGRAVEDVAHWLYPDAFGLIGAVVDTTTEPYDGGLRLSVAVEHASAEAGPVTVRFLPGDGSDASAPDGPSWSHEYPGAGSYEAHVLIIDAHGRVLDHRIAVEVP